jgi:hypothetical protein
MRIIIYTASDHDNFATHSADTWLKTLQAIFDTSQGFLNAILFVFFSTENMKFISQSLCGTSSWLLRMISCGRDDSSATGEGGEEESRGGGHEGGYAYDESSSYYLSGRPDHSSDVINRRLLSLEEQEDEEDEEQEVAWDGQLSYQRNGSHQDTTTSRQIKCSFAEG